METFSDRLLREHQALWQAMQRHPFVEAIVENRLAEEDFHRYLVYEGDFVATAVKIVALGVSHAPSLSRQRWLIGGLNALVDTQLGWFDAVLARRGVQKEKYQPIPPGIARFHHGMLLAAQRGGYADIITLMFGAEWMYYHWCARAAACPQADSDLSVWLEMHVDDAFYGQACWLKEELDCCAQGMDDAQKQRLSALYADVLRWEIDFHSAMLAT